MKIILLSVVSFFVTVPLFAQNTLYFDEQEALFRAGLDLFDKTQYASARRQFEKYISKSADPLKKADAEYYRAYCALALYHGDGERSIEDFIKEYPDHPKAATAYYELGKFYFKQKHYKKASKYLEKVNLTRIAEAERQETRFKLGYSLFAQRKLEKALPYFNVLKRKPGSYSSASAYYAGYIEYHQKEYDKAIADLERAVEDETYAKAAPELLASLYYRQKRYDELKAFAEPFAQGEDSTRHKKLSLMLGDAYLLENQPDKAGDFYKRYGTGNAGASRDVRYRLGYINYVEENFDEAINLLKRVASDDDSIGVYASYYLGVMYLKKGNKLYAQTAFFNARENKFSQVLQEEGAYQYAKVTYDLGRAEESVEAMNYFLEKYPESAYTREINGLLSEAYLTSSSYDLAIAQIEKSGIPEKLRGTYQKATYFKGSELFNKGDYRRAIDYFDKSLEHPIASTFTLLAGLWAGEAHSVGRKYEEAQPYYRQVLGNAGDADRHLADKARYGLAYAYYNTGQYTKARGHFKALAEDGKQPRDKYHADALVRLADCYYVDKQYSKAIAYYRTASENRRSDQDYALYQLGLVYGITAEVDKAIASFDKVLAFSGSPYGDDAMFQKGRVRLEQGDYPGAVRNFSALIASRPASKFIPYTLLRRGSAHYNMKNYDETIADYTRILSEYITHKVASEVLLPLQEVLSMQNRSEEFNAWLAQYKAANPDKTGLDQVDFETAKNRYFNLDYKDAIKQLDAFMAEYPDHPYTPEAKFYKAESYYRLRDYEPALVIYNELFEVLAFAQRNRVIDRIAEIEYRSGRYRNAIYFYNELESVASGKKQQYNAWAGLMETHFLLGEYDSTISYARVILEGGDVHISSQNKALLYLGKSALAKGNYDLAEDEFIATINSAKDQYGAEAQYLLGELYYTRAQYPKSIETLIAVNNDFNTYTEWVGKAFLLLADNYLAMDDTFQAIGTLQSVADDFPDEYYRTKAKEKINTIKAMQKAKESLESISTDSLSSDN